MIKVTFIGGSLDGFQKVLEVSVVEVERYYRYQAVSQVPPETAGRGKEVRVAMMQMTIEKYEFKHWISPNELTHWVAFYIGEEK